MSFLRQTTFDVEYAPARISKWRSARTGLQLTYIAQPLPIVNGYFAVATETPDDLGCPHTLEHLVFMGLAQYPYKGLLDSLGNRFFSSTNAWTGVDQTVYTLTTAGWEGFRTLLPVYLDHLLRPTLTDAACTTEVYHIDGRGREKGVVFLEMQGIESQLWFVSYLALQKTLYAKSSGYSSETGGLMAELRHLSNDQIRAFHANNYRPDNLCVVVTGSVDEAELLRVMEDFDSALPALPAQPLRRPFVDSPHDLPLAHSVTKRVEFPDEDESMGEVVVGWIGPRSSDTLNNLAVDMVGSYLTDTPISLFNRVLVETADPLATEIVYGTDDYVRTGLNFTLSGVPTERLAEAAEKIALLLAQQTDESALDLLYMRQVLSQQRLKYVANTEKSATTFSNVAILEFIYGNPNGSDLAAWTKDLKEFDQLAEWSAAQWCALIKEFFVDNHPAVILGVPSAQLNKKLKQEAKQRAKQIKQQYGPEGLAELGKKLQQAQDENDRPLPDEVLTSFGKPDPSKIDFIHTDSYRAGANHWQCKSYETKGAFFDVLKDDTPQDFPLWLHFENYKSRFVTVQIVMSFEAVPEKLLRYLSVIEEIFTLSIKLPSGEYIPYDKVITDMNNDLIEFQLDNGFENQFVELSSVKIKFEVDKYEKAIQWLINVFKYSVFEESRVKIIIEKIINSLPDKKRNDELMMYSKQHRTVYNDKSIRKSQDSIYTEEFYKELLEKINNGGYADIERDLNEIRDALFSTANMKVFAVGGCSALRSPVSTWTKFVKEFSGKPSHFSLESLPRAYQFKTPVGKECSKQAFVVLSPAGESTHMLSLTPVPTDYMDEDIFKIALASEFLAGVEGPFWRGIRGTGLAYGASIRRLVESGYLSFTIYRGADAQQAWLTGKQIISDYATGKLEIDAVSIENSVAAIVNELANNESNAYDASTTKITDDLFKKRGPGYLQHFLKKLDTYTSEDMVYIMNKYFLPLFDAEKSLIFTCLPIAKSEEFSLFLQSQGYNVSTEEINATADANANSDSEETDSEEELDESGSEEYSDEKTEDESDESENE